MRKAGKGKLLNYIFIVLLFLTIFYLVFGEMYLPEEKWGDSDQFKIYNEAWERILPSGKKEKIDIPSKLKAERNETIEIETVLPADIDDDIYLCFRSAKQDLKFYIDGRLRQEYSTKKTRVFGKVSAVGYIFVKLDKEDAGKVLLMQAQTDSSYTGIFYTVYMGSQKAIWEYYIRHYGAEVLVAFLLMTLGMIVIVVSLFLRFRYRQRVPLLYLGLGVSVASVWLLANSVFRQLFFPNLAVINDVAFCTIMLLPFPFLIFMDEVQKGRYRPAYLLAEILAVIDFIVCSVLHIFKIVDYTDTVVYMTVICALTIIIMIVGIGLDIVRGYMKDYVYVGLGLLAAFVSAVVQIFVYFNRTALFNGVYLAAGLLFLLCFAVISTIRDLLALEKEKTQAVLASESKGRFLANMSHEIRTPINAVLGMNAVILRESKEPAIREYAMDINNAGQILLSLINDILDLSKIESGKMEITPIRYDLSSLIYDVFNMITMKVQKKNLNIKLLLDKSLPSGLYGDDVRLRQVLMNLMNNAVKYTSEGSVALIVRRAKGKAKSKDKILLHFGVRDTGTGIKKEDMGKLFQEFERLDMEENRYIEGTGLGMSITLTLLKMMGTTLEVDSKYGEGSNFFFDIEQGIWKDSPVGDLESRIKNQAENYTYQVTFQAPNAEILVVDDNSMNRKVFKGLLKETKLHIDEAAGGKEALEMIREKHYDLIFLDHMMPEMDGIETFHKIERSADHLCQGTPVIVLTANAISGAREMYLDEGFQGYLSKPVDPDKLEEILMKELPEDKIVLEKKELLSQEEKAEKKIVFPDIEGIEWEIALHKMKNDTLLFETAKNFYDLNEAEALTLGRFLQQISAGDQGALDEFRIKVHSMKSSAALIGAMSVSALARVLEKSAAERNEAFIMHVTPLFLEEWRELKQRMQKMFGKEAQEKKAPDYFMLLEYLKLLKPAIEDMDIDTSDEIVHQLKLIQYTQEEEGLIEELALAVAEIDAERTIALAELLEELFMEHMDD